MRDREAFLRRFHAARPGCTSAALVRNGAAPTYDRLVAAAPRGARILDLGCGDAYLVSRLGPRAVGLDLAPGQAPDGSPGRAVAGVAAGRGEAGAGPPLGAAAVLGAAMPGAPQGTAGALGAAMPGAPRGTAAGQGRAQASLFAGAAIVQGRAQAMPFADDAFDASVCHLAFMLFDDLDQVVRELRRVVVPGGRFTAVLGGGPTADDPGDDAFHRFLGLAPLRGPALGDRRATSEAGWRALFGGAPRFTRLEVDLTGSFDEVWRFLGASYQLSGDDAPAVRAELAASYGTRSRVPCRAVFWLAEAILG